MLANLKAALRERGFTQDRLGTALGLSRATMGRVVVGERELEPDLQRRAAEILHADREWLFSGVRFIPPPREAERETAVACAANE